MVKNIVVINICALLLSACSAPSGTWKWRHPDAGYEEKYRARDIHECEQYALEADMNGKRQLLRPARDYGGWGNFSFEFCMQERGWSLEFEEWDR